MQFAVKPFGFGLWKWSSVISKVRSCVQSRLQQQIGLYLRKKIDCYVTLDEGILKRRGEISRLLESRVASPAEAL